MFNFKKKKDFLLKEEPEPEPVPGQVPEFQPPEYSSVFGSQSQSYNPVPSAPTASGDPVQMPIPQDTTIYNPTSQVTVDNREPISQPGFHPTYAPTTYDPIANTPPVNQESTPDQTIIISSPSANASKRAKRCCCCKSISTALSVILIVLGAGAKSAKGTQGYKNTPVIFPKELLGPEPEHYPSNYDSVRQKLNEAILQQQNYNGLQSGNRYRRMVGEKEIEDFKDNVHVDFNDQTLFDKLFKPEKSVRQRRDLKIKYKLGERKIKLSTRKKKYYKSKINSADSTFGRGKSPLITRFLY